MKIRKHLMVLTTLALLATAGCQQAARNSAESRDAEAAPLNAAGNWHLVVEVESFHHGRLGRIARTVDLSAGRLRSRWRQGRLEVAMTLRVAGGRAKGQMFVDPGPAWDGVSIPFEGPIENGSLALDLWGTASYLGFPGPWRRDRDARVLDVRLRISRRRDAGQIRGPVYVPGGVKAR